MKSVKCLAYSKNEDPCYNGVKRTPLTVPSGGKLDEHTQAVEEEGCCGHSLLKVDVLRGASVLQVFLIVFLEGSAVKRTDIGFKTLYNQRNPQ